MRLQVLPVEQITARLGDAFGLLTGGGPTALPQQQTLRRSRRGECFHSIGPNCSDYLVPGSSHLWNEMTIVGLARVLSRVGTVGHDGVL